MVASNQTNVEKKSYVPVFDANNVKTGALRVTYCVEDDCVYFKMAKPFGNINLSKGVIPAGTKVFDWNNALFFKLSWENVAILAMASDLQNIKNWDNTLANWVHNFNGRMSILDVTKNEKNSMALSISLRSQKGQEKLSVFLPMMPGKSLEFGKCMDYIGFVRKMTQCQAAMGVAIKIDTPKTVEVVGDESFAQTYSTPQQQNNQQYSYSNVKVGLSQEDLMAEFGN